MVALFRTKGYPFKTAESSRDPHREMNLILEQPAAGDRIPNSSCEANHNPDSPGGFRHPMQPSVDHRIPRVAALQGHENSGSDYFGDKRAREPEVELGKVKAELDAAKGQLDRYHKKHDRAMDEILGVRNERNGLEMEIKSQLERFNQEYTKISDEFDNKYTVLEKKQEELKRDYDAALEVIKSQKLDIDELTVEISHSVKISGTITRDDDYFEAKFASLEGAVRQWVLRSFRGIRNQNLPRIVQDSLKAVVFNYNPKPDSKVSLREIEAMILGKLRTNVFCPAFVLTTHEQYRNISEALGGTGNFFPLSHTVKEIISLNHSHAVDLESREWRSQTVGKLLKRDPHGDHVRHGVQDAEKDLLDYHGFLPRGDGDEKRRKSLFAIVKQAGELQVEVFQQVSPFKLYQISPGAPYNSNFMDDISNLVDEDEEGARIFLVRVVIFPAVLRWGFDEDGKFSAPVVVRKGTVIAMRSED